MRRTFLILVRQLREKNMSSAAILEDIRHLVDRALAGDQSAMMQIVDRYKQRVFGLCYRMLQQREDAEDVSQEAFVRVLKNLARWDQQREFEPWLFTIVANRCRTQLARRKTSVATHSLPFAPADETWTNETSAEQLREELQLAMLELPSNHSRAFFLFHHQHLGYAQISKEMGIPEGTAKTWVHRARRELANRLASRNVVEQRHAMQ